MAVGRPRPRGRLRDIWYDRLIEIAIGAFRRVRGVDELVRGDDGTLQSTRVYKLHGSVDWGYRIGPKGRKLVMELDQTRQLSELVRNGATPTDEIVRTTIGRPTGERLRYVYAQARDDGGVLYPAIALPARGKGAFVLPQWQLDQLRADLSRATRFLFVGWRGMDEHFLRMLRTSGRPGRPVDVVARSSGQGLAAKLHRALRTRNPAMQIHGTFSDYVDTPRLLLDLLGRRPAGNLRR